MYLFILSLLIIIYTFGVLSHLSFKESYKFKWDMRVFFLYTKMVLILSIKYNNKLKYIPELDDLLKIWSFGNEFNPLNWGKVKCTNPLMKEFVLFWEEEIEKIKV